MSQEEKKTEVKTDAYLELQVKTLEKKNAELNTALKAANDELEKVKEGEVLTKMEELKSRYGFDDEDLEGKSLSELNAMLAVAFKVQGKRGIQPGGDTTSKASGLTAGRWDPSKKEWVV